MVLLPEVSSGPEVQQIKEASVVPTRECDGHHHGQRGQLGEGHEAEVQVTRCIH